MSKFLSKLSVPLSALMMLWAIPAGVALADTSYTPAGSFATTQGSGDGETSDPQHLAVETSTGNVLLVDRGNNRVQVFALDVFGSATYLTQFGSGVLNAPSGIVIDQDNGDVYVSDGADVVKFASDGAPTPTYTQDATFASPGLTGPLAFDQTAHQLVVAATDHVRRYSTSGAAATSFDGSSSGTAFTALKDITVQDDSDVVVIDNTRVLRFESDDSYAATLAGTPDAPSALAAIPGTDSLLVARLGGYSPDFTRTTPSAQLFRYSGDAYKGTTVLPANIQGIAGLAIGAGGVHQLYATAGPGNYTYGDVGVESLTPFAVAAPTVTATASPSQAGARLSAAINTNNDQTTWTFEYGTTAAYGSHYPASPVAAGPAADPVEVTRSIGGLQPGTVYHYRVVATNGGGTTVSPDQTFTTKQHVLPASGGNAEGRAYEMISPPDKGGAAVDPFFTTVSSADGQRVAFLSKSAFPGAADSVLFSYYLGTRGADQWSTDPVDPAQSNSNRILQNPTVWFSADLTRSVQYSARALLPGAYEGGGNLYLRDNLTGKRTLIAAVPGRNKLGEEFATLNVEQRMGAADDLSKFVFSSVEALTPGATQGQSNVYEWSSGALHLASILPDGTPATQGAKIRSLEKGVNVMSQDGARIVFQSPLTDPYAAPLYTRADGITTAVSVSRRPGDPATPQDANLRSVSRDGRKIYFSTNAPLTVDSLGQSGLYVYDTSTGSLTLVSRLADPGDAFPSAVSHRMSVGSDDGEYLYFHSQSKLTPDAQYYAGNFYVAHDGDVKLVATLTEGYEYSGISGGLEASPNGRYFAFTSIQQLTDQSNRGASCKADPNTYGNAEGHCPEVYLYDAVDDSLRCVSCRAVDGAPALSELRGEEASASQYRSRKVLDDGSVFFDSNAKLAPADVNGVRDAYRWKDGQVSLVSSGKDPRPSYFVDAGPDARDIYFATSERLVAQDVDGDLDLYDFRVGAGLPKQNEHVAVQDCQGDGCQRAGVAPPAPAVVKSNGAGSGNPAAVVRAAFSGGLPTSAQMAGLARGKRVGVKVKVNRAGLIRLTGRAKLEGRTRVVLSASRTAAKAGTYVLTVRLSAVARRSLGRHRSLRVTLVSSFAGVRTPHTATRTLRVSDAAKSSANPRAAALAQTIK